MRARGTRAAASRLDGSLRVVQRPLVARAALVLGVLLLALSALTGAAGAQEGEASGERPPLWRSSSAATAVQGVFNTDPPLLPLEEFVNVNAPYGESSWDSSGTAAALVGSLYPGSSGTQGPALLCEFAGNCPEGFPPSYPLSAKASHPTDPDAATQDGAATAHAGLDFVETNASGSQALGPALGPLSAVFSAGSVTAHTSQSFSDDASTVSAEAVATLEDVSLFGGAVHIDQIQAISISQSAGQGAVARDNRVVVSGVTAAGQPAEITDEGVVITGEGGGGEAVAQANQALQQALEQFGGSVRTLGTTEGGEDGTATGSARGLLIGFRTTVEGPPLPPAPDGFPIEPNSVYRDYYGTMTLGLADSLAFANTEGFGLSGGDLGGLGDAGDGGAATGGDAGADGGADGLGTTPSGSSDSGLSGSAPVSQPAGGNDPAASSDDGASPEVAAPADGSVQAAATDEAALLGDASADLTRRIYLGGGIAALLLFGLSRVPRRLLPSP